MATLVRTGTPAITPTYRPPISKIGPILVGADVANGDFVYIKNDGKAYKSDGTAANAAASVKGIALVGGLLASAASITILSNVQVTYGTALTPGAYYYASATPGSIDDAATTGGLTPVAYAVNTTDIHVLPPH